jgi:hypothetical protein
VLLNLTFQVYNVQYTNYQCYDIDMHRTFTFRSTNTVHTPDDKFYYSAVGHAFVQYLTLRFYLQYEYVHKLLMFCQCVLVVRSRSVFLTPIIEGVAFLL